MSAYGHSRRPALRDAGTRGLRWSAGRVGDGGCGCGSGRHRCRTVGSGVSRGDRSETFWADVNVRSHNDRGSDGRLRLRLQAAGCDGRYRLGRCDAGSDRSESTSIAGWYTSWNGIWAACLS